MKISVIHLILLLFSITSLSAQTLKGTVLDAQTGDPVAFASVYLEGTTVGTSTGLDGKFSLDVKNRIYTRLIVSLVGYESVIVLEPYESLPEIIYMEEKGNALDEVVITGKPVFSRAQKLRAFRKIFLGDTEAGNSCKILNEDDIKLFYDIENKTFSASSNVPVEIMNLHLGYNIHWEMITFHVQYNKPKTLNEKYADKISIVGLASYLDQSRKNTVVAENREDVYRFSSKRFFNLLANEKIDDSDMFLYDNKCDSFLWADSLFTIITDMPEELSARKITVNFPENTNDSKNDRKEMFSVEVKNITVDKKALHTVDERKGEVRIRDLSRSQIFLFRESFNVDAYGNTDLVEDFLITGYMGKRRIGDALPVDYMPSSDFDIKIWKKNNLDETVKKRKEKPFNSILPYKQIYK